GEHVLDLFAGSGSTLIAAEQTRRKAFLMEIDALYCDIIVQRWQQFTGREAQRVCPTSERLPCPARSVAPGSRAEEKGRPGARGEPGLRCLAGNGGPEGRLECADRLSASG